MSRWRPPKPKSAPYITPQGYNSLELEIKELWKRRVDVTRALTAAAAEGDRSENAEYIYRKKELRGIDSRIGFLQGRMPKLKVVDKVEDSSRVFFGAWLTLEDESEQESRYRIVGPDELDSELNYISIDSPLARALLGKNCDDEIILKLGENIRTYTILEISYE
jgi:transcription elongation factor GreB